eukprot:CAMPEP_0171774400 /NCGR_PEP_ID=MMETSP0991-20121206/55863_1 /TAXON_ID=483369 /ORGANISM="non described non described, Strain CCMP2098" /LENGTH=150 /DNA_ID=CAMNT_0012380315 /DNA_START=86 /DNA_END=534 /DNA_ORIENTATION=+
MLATSALGVPGVCVYKWDSGTLTPQATLDHWGDSGATDVSINCNNQVVATASEMGEIVLALPETCGPSKPGRPLYSFTPLEDREVRSVCFDPSSRYIACGGEFEHVYIWDLKKKKKVRELKGHAPNGSVACVQYSSDGHLIASGGSGGAV